MKVIDGKLEPKSETCDLTFRKYLKEILNEWFDLRLKDILTIIRKLGIKDENYELTYVSSLSYIDTYGGQLCVELKRKDQCNLIIFRRGQMPNPYPPRLIFDDKEYYLGRTVTVDEY